MSNKFEFNGDDSIKNNLLFYDGIFCRNTYREKKKLQTIEKHKKRILKEINLIMFISLFQNHLHLLLLAVAHSSFTKCNLFLKKTNSGKITFFRSFKQDNLKIISLKLHEKLYITIKASLSARCIYLSFVYVFISVGILIVCHLWKANLVSKRRLFWFFQEKILFFLFFVINSCFQIKQA